MRIETTTRTLYQFDELDASAKERARDWFREINTDDTYWSECVIDDFRTIAPLLGFSIRGTNPNNKSDNGGPWFDLYRRKCSFSGSWYQSDMKLAALKEHAPLDVELARIGDALAAIKHPEDCGGGPYAGITAGGYSGRYVAFECDYMSDDDIDAFKELAGDLCAWLLKSLETEYEYQNSAECVDENIRCNEYEFTETGAPA